MVTSNDVIEAIFGGVGDYKAKSILFGILLLIIATVFLFQLIRKNPNYRTAKITALVFCISLSIALAFYNFGRASTPPVNFTPRDMWLGNESENITQKNYDRLEYLQKNLVFAKRTWCDTPSRFDYNDDGTQDYLDNADDFYKTHTVEPQWDVHVYIYNDTTIFKIILFYANQKNQRHTLDFEYIEMYYKNSDENLTSYKIPNYVSFPTYADIVSHPRIFITWDEMPDLHNDVKCLALDPDTNSFSKDFDRFPAYKDNYRLTWITPDSNEYLDYLTQTEKIQFSLGLMGAFSVLLYIVFAKTKRIYTLLYLMFILFAIAFYPLVTLQYDYVTSPTFRIWTDSTPSDEAFYNSKAGREYITTYNTSWNRASWSTPDNVAIC